MRISNDLVANLNLRVLIEDLTANPNRLDSSFRWPRVFFDLSLPRPELDLNDLEGEQLSNSNFNLRVCYTGRPCTACSICFNLLDRPEHRLQSFGNQIKFDDGWLAHI